MKLSDRTPNDLRDMARRAREMTSIGELGRQFRFVMLASALLGVLTGLGVVAFDYLVGERLLPFVLDLPVGVYVAAPLVGFLVSYLLVRRAVPSGDHGTTDAYVRAYHQRHSNMPLKDLAGKLAASAATLGFGGAMGFEGPSILIGGTLGSASTSRRFRRWMPTQATRPMIVAGAAAGVAAVFKAPLTGVVFALEVPFQEDLARRALLPALVAAASSYLVFASFLGTEPIMPISGAAPFGMAEVTGMLLLGVACGVLARIGAWSIRLAKGLTLPAWQRAVGAGVALAVLAFASVQLFGEPLSLGPGYRTVGWAVEAHRGFWLLVVLFAIRAAATWFAVAGGGVGGLFIPLVVQGAVTGAAVQALVGIGNATLFPVVGVAAFLGAGYRTPLAGVAFVAEATGQHGFVVPALIAAVAAQVVMGNASFSPYQHREREGRLESLLSVPVSAVMNALAETVPADASIADFNKMQIQRRHRWFPVVANGRYLGTMSLLEASTVPSDRWDRVRVERVMRWDLPTVEHNATLRSAIQRMERAGTKRLAVLEDRQVVGVLTQRDIAEFESSDTGVELSRDL